MRSYLQLTRAHTAPLETVPAAGGALLATGGSITLGVMFWTLFGFVYHLAGYGQNSLADWENGYDKEDPNKQHHPLNKGSITHKRAKITVLFLISVSVAMALGWLMAYPSGAALLYLVVGAACGVYYNKRGKETKLKPLYISVAHSSVFAIPYLALGGSATTGFVLATLMVISWVFYQIAVSGEVKDIHQDEENFLLNVGYKRFGGVVYPNFGVLMLTFAIRAVVVLMAVLTAYTLGAGISIMWIIVIVGLMSAYHSYHMMWTNINKRWAALTNMSFIEITSLAMFLAMLSPVITTELMFWMFVLSGAWVVALNKLLWGTYIAPDV